jgi:hypothetical protein
LALSLSESSGVTYASTRSRFGVYREIPEIMESVRNLERVSLSPRFCRRACLHRADFCSPSSSLARLLPGAYTPRMNVDYPYCSAPTHYKFLDTS